MKIDIDKIKGIIFDYGGTLDTAGEHWSEVIWDAYRQAGVIAEKAQFREAYVFAERELARERHILPAHDFNDLLQIKIKIQLQFLSEHYQFPPQLIDEKGKMVADICYQRAKETVASTIPVLEQLSEKYPMVLVSNFYGNIETVLEDFGIRKFFKGIIESAVMGVRKPDPRIFEHGVKALGVMPDETLVIGDSYRKDIVPAESIGCQVLWLKGQGWTAEEDEQLHPNIIKSLGEVLDIVVG